MSSERILDYFEQMIKLGIWKREFSKDEYKQLFMQFLIISHNWIQYVQIDNNSPLSISKELARFAKISQSLFKPYLVETK